MIKTYHRALNLLHSEDQSMLKCQIGAVSLCFCRVFPSEVDMYV